MTGERSDGVERNTAGAAGVIQSAQRDPATVESVADQEVSEKAGAALFADGVPVYALAGQLAPDTFGAALSRGWWVAWARAYAAGALAFHEHDNATENPHAHLSAAWEAWAQGWDDAAAEV